MSVSQPTAVARLSLAAMMAMLSTGALRAGTIWDGEGATTNVNLADNWDGTPPGVVNALDGTTAAEFGTGGSLATLNVAARFTTVKFNRDSAAGFTIAGPSALSINPTASGSTINLAVDNTAGNGVVTLNAPVQMHTTGVSGNRFLNIRNDETDLPTGSLIVNGNLNASTAANTFQIRAGGNGVTVFNGAISNINGIQQLNLGSPGSAGRVVVDGAQALGASTPVNIPSSSSGTVTSAFRIEMGTDTADVQSWGATTINQHGTVAINSTATMGGTLSISAAASGAASGGKCEINGTLNGAALAVGSGAYFGILKVAGTASFSGAVSSGATAGSEIVGNAATNGTITFTSGTINGTGTRIGGDEENENNLNIIKNGTGLLTIAGGTHTYTGTTTVNAGTLAVSGDIESPVTVNSGGTFSLSGTSGASVTVASGGTFGLGGTVLGDVSLAGGGSLSGEGLVNGELNLGAGTSVLSFDAGTGTGLQANTVVAAPGANMVVVPTGTTTIGTPYLVMTSAAGLAGITFTAGAPGSVSLQNGDTELWFTPAAAVARNLTWTGIDSTNPTYWNLAVTPNWSDGASAIFFNGDNLTFNDTATTFNVLVQGSAVAPGNVVFNNPANAYTLTGAGIGGTGSLTKNGAATVSIANALSQSGGIEVNAGLLDLTGTNTFGGNITLNGGQLQFNGSIANSLNTRPVTLAGGTLIYKSPSATITNDTQLFNITTDGSGIKVDTSANAVWRIGAKISGGGDFTKTGAGILSFGTGGNTDPGNDFTGKLTVNEGTMDVRHPLSLGDTTEGTEVNGAILVFQNFGQTAGTYLNEEPLSFTGSAFLSAYCQEAGKAFFNQLSGGINVAAGATLGISTARTSSTVTAPVLEVDTVATTTGAGSVVRFGTRAPTYQGGFSDVAQFINHHSALTGPGSVETTGSTGSVYTLDLPDYSGDTTLSGNATLSLKAANPSNQGSQVSIATTATLNLDFSGTDTVNKLFIGGVQQGMGTYAAADSVLPGVIPTARITGSGTLTVSSGPGYAGWAAENGIPGEPAIGDFDKDGLSNLVEYALGLDPAVAGGAPGSLVGKTLTFNKGADAIANGDVLYIIETSTDVGVADTWDPAVTQSPPNAATTIEFTLPDGPTENFARLRVELVP